jgi:O-antigen/teichoic acid export membrane protein
MGIKNKYRIFFGGFKDMFWYTFATLGSKLVQFMVIPILAAKVASDELAKYDLFLTYSSFLIVMFTLGMDSGLGVKCTEYKDDIGKINFYFSGSLKSISLIFLFLSLVWLIAFLANFNNMLFYFITLLYAFILSIYTMLIGLQRWLGHVKKATFVILITNIFGYGFGLAFLFLTKYDTHYLLLGIVFGTLLGVLISLYVSRAFLTDFFRHKLDKEFFRFFKISIPIVGASFGIQSRKLLERFTVLYFFDDIALGRYALLSRIVQVPEIGIQVLGNAFFPRILKEYDSEEGKKTSHMVMNMFLTLILAGSIFCYFFSDQIILFIADSSYLTFSKFMLPVFLFTGLNCILYFSGFGFFIKAKTNQYSLLIIASVFFSAIFSFLALHFIKNVSILITVYIVSSVLYATLYLLFSEKLFKMQYNPITYYLIVALGLLGIASLALNN